MPSHEVRPRRPGPRRSRMWALAAAVPVLLVGPLAPAARAGGDPVGGPLLAGPGLVWSHTAGVPAPPATAATSYLLADATSGDVLVAKGAHVRLRPASTQKILTALTLLPQIEPETVYTAQQGDAAVEGSKVGMVPGAPYTVEQMWQALFLVSGNDAATGLAEVAGGVRPTLTAMRAEAHDLQADDTSLVNVTGLDASGQLSSAYDLALVARAGLGRADFRRYTGTVKAQFPGKLAPAGKPRPTFQIYTQDRLLLNYPGAIGVKTGFTTLARSTFVGAATRNGRTLVVTLMHTTARSWREAAALLDWGFAHAAQVTPVGTLVEPLSAQAAATDGAASATSTGSHRSLAALQRAGVGGWGGVAMPWWAWVVAVLAGTGVALRSRVLLRRRRRLRRLA